MGFALGRKEAAAVGLKRRLEAEISAAREALVDEAAGVEARVHAARRRLKRARSILVALAPAVGKHAEKDRRAVRDIARALAGTRDADVLAGTAAELVGTAPPEDRPALAALADGLRARATTARAAAPPIEETTAALEAVEARIAARELPKRSTRRRDVADDLLADALAEAYADGRDAMRKAARQPVEARMHAWRKTVKHRWHLTRLAERRLLGADRATANRLDRLAETLGQEHDLAVLLTTLAAEPGLAGDAAGTARVTALVERRRQLLADAAMALGELLYRVKPKAFRAGLAELEGG